MILAILQARMSSTRLPGKVLRPLAGAPMIVRQVERLRRCRRFDDLVVAISDDRTDDVLQDVLQHAGIRVARGPLDDVLARFVRVLEAEELEHSVEHVVRLTADCPFAEPALVDAVIDRHLETGADYTSNTPEPRTFPKGLDCEVMTSAALITAAAEATAPEDREHVTRFIYHRPERFQLAALSQEAAEGDVRWTVDRPDDYAFASAVYDALYPRDPEFGAEDIRAFVRNRPDLSELGGDRRV